MSRPLLAIVGPTASGKSALALSLALKYDGEIVSADSRQVYRLMDIGTAKPPPHELSAVVHHLINVVHPDEPFNLSMFLERAKAAIADIHAKSRLPIVVGGTGQWVWALLEGWDVPVVTPNPQFRASLERLAKRKGYQALYEKLSRVAPAAAARIDARNVRRVIRAMEIASDLGTSASAAPHKIPPSFDTKLFGITIERSELYHRIDDRVDSMIVNGWVDEVSGLLEQGYAPELASMSGIGYSELVKHLRGEMALDTAVERIKFSTHRFARGQYAWFRPSDARIRWYDLETELKDTMDDVSGWISNDQSN